MTLKVKTKLKGANKGDIMTIDLSKLDLKQLIALGGRDFYKFVQNKQDLMTYLNEVCMRVCQENGLTVSPQLSIVDLQGETMGISLLNNIGINAKLLNCFDIFKMLNNTHYVFMLISTVIHETRHFLQLGSLDNIDPIVKGFTAYHLTVPEFSLMPINYPTDVREVDARYYTYQVLNRDDTFKRHIYNKYYIDREMASSMNISSLAQSLLLNLAHIDNYSRATSQIVYSMKALYSEFLKGINLDLSMFSSKLQLTDGNLGKVLAQILYYGNLINDVINKYQDKIKKNSRMELKMQRHILELGKKEIDELAVSEDVKQLAKDFLRMHAMTSYESCMLYSKIAPDFDNFKYVNNMPNEPDSQNEFISIYSDYLNRC